MIAEAKSKKKNNNKNKINKKERVFDPFSIIKVFFICLKMWKILNGFNT